MINAPACIGDAGQTIGQTPGARGQGLTVGFIVQRVAIAVAVFHPFQAAAGAVPLPHTLGRCAHPAAVKKVDEHAEIFRGCVVGAVGVAGERQILPIPLDNGDGIGAVYQQRVVR